MYFIQATSRITGVVMYFSGRVVSHSEDTYSVELAWTPERRFATRFSTELLADKIADTRRTQANNIVLSVEYERDNIL